MQKTSTPALPNKPTIFIIFGATGDLSRSKLLPSLIDLCAGGLLPSNFKVIGFSRREMDDMSFRDFVCENLGEHIEKHGRDNEYINHFLANLHYAKGDFKKGEGYEALQNKIDEAEKEFGVCANKLFYLAVAPSMFGTIFGDLDRHRLTEPCGDEEGWSRILVEKPFGNNADTARDLDSELGNLFSEEQIFRIDHYLAKETVQNILAFRFHNPFFESLWHAEHISHVHIRFLETGDVSDRGAFYDGIGTLRDVGQNHILQMLALIAMERPESFDTESIRSGRAKVLSELRKFGDEEIETCVTRGQYEGYRDTKGVEPDSRTETYFKLRTFIDSDRWSGVPFYLESGKALDRKEVCIDVHFKSGENDAEENVLTFRIQPDEGIGIKFFVKIPGFNMELAEKTLSFSYDELQKAGEGESVVRIPDAYERVLFDAIAGDQSRFASTEEVGNAWEFIMSVLDKWDRTELHTYAKGENPDRIGEMSCR